MDEQTAAGIQSGINSVSSAAAYIATDKTNKESKEWMEKMYGLQRADALKDWNMQNEYNSPSSQMARLKAAGLNPNLVYGHGADTTTGPVRSSSAGSWNPQAPRLDKTDVLGQYYNTQLQQATLDNLKAQNTVLQADAFLKQAQARNVSSSADETNFDIGMKNKLSDLTVMKAQADYDKTNNEIELMMQTRDFKDAWNPLSIQEQKSKLTSMALDQARTAADTERIKKNVESMDLNNVLQKLEINRQRMGIQKNDPLYARALAAIWSNITGQTDSSTRARTSADLDNNGNKY